MNTFKHIYILLLTLKCSNYIIKNNMVIHSQYLSVTMVGSLRTLSKEGKLQNKTREQSHCRKICRFKYCRKHTGLCGPEYYVLALY
jgi:hypothetical protein